eukprot:CAMPEP_0116028884 /NCGR_PEP_ID=MMETSP0321-20121206/15743_1 /TAXON_ID=163516 /ORGANISM="Leptocylindrus danicus var. danicus, Strain B650" /LENGTH=86 /DNA_ID=CAMNT_0003503021 /DNA_START=17 /DNA_END=274 /DNA_ORIENTATION=-
MAPMCNPRAYFTAALKDNYIYINGGYDIDYEELPWIERYSIENNTWEELADVPKGRRSGHCAISTRGGSEIFIVGGHTCSVDVFDT